MSQGLFDDLARALATPMPRRGALRTIATALAATAFGALRPASAAAVTGQAGGCSPRDCGQPGLKFCCVPVGDYDGFHSTGCCGDPGREDCCIGPNDDLEHPNPMTWCCPKGKCAASLKAAGGKCSGPQDCDQDKNEIQCGKTCCKLDSGEFCGSAKHSLCCKVGDKPCLSGELGICCKPDQSPCWDASHVTCCNHGQKCGPKGSTPPASNRNVCGCVPGTTVCGSQCCTKTESCCAGAGDGKCCKAGESCGAIAGAPGNKNCCPTARIVTTATGRVCCPTGTVGNGKGGCCPANNPQCCGAKPCARGTICSLGECVPF